MDPETLNKFSPVVEGLGFEIGGWRGQAELDWRLDSGAVRRLHEPRPEEDPLEMPPEYLEEQLREYENRLMQRARMAGHGHHDGRELSDLELLALLQHHGAATRLLDCTRNAYIALWFAASEHPDRYGLVIGLDLAGSFAVHEATTLRKPMRDLLDEAGTRLSFWWPSALSPRIPAQQGFFLWGQARYRPWGSIGGEPLPDNERDTSRALPRFVCLAVPLP
jgi:hypothetical protein